MPKQATVRDERRLRAASGRRRAQMYLVQLRWLEGFAAGGRWYVVGGAPEELVLDGPMLARARRVANKLRHSFARAMAGLVGDVERWYEGVDAVLAPLGALGRGGPGGAPTEGVGPRERQAIRELEARAPRLRPLVRAAASAWRLRTDALSPALRWMRARAAALEPLVAGAVPRELCRLLALALLAAECEGGVDALLALLAADVPDAGETRVALVNLLHRLNGDRRAAAPLPRRSAPIAAAWIDRLLARPPAERLRALELFATLDVPAVTVPWKVWEGEHTPRIARAEAVVAGGLERLRWEDVIRLFRGVERANAALPALVPFRALLAAAEELAAVAAEPFRRAALRLLRAFPADQPRSRMYLLVHAAGVASSSHDNPRIPRLWEALAAELEAGAGAPLLGPWQDILDGTFCTWREEDLLRELRSGEVRRLPRAIARLAQARADGQAVSVGMARQLASALSAGFEVEEAVALVSRLAPLEVSLGGPLVRAGAALVGRDAATLAGTLARMHARSVELDWDREELAEVCERAATAGHGWLVLGLLDGDASRLLELGNLVRLAPGPSWPRFELSDSPPDWISRYPPALQPALSRLAAVDPQAQETARRRLAADLPDRAALEREAASLRARPASTEPERRRLRNLEARIAAPRLPSPVRLQRLAAKIEAAALSLGATRLAAALTVAAQARVQSALGLPSWPDWPMDRMRWSVLVGLVGLGPVDRALAGRLLRARAGAPPWDLRDEPANRRFLSRVRALGLDLAPWLDDTARVVTAGDGQPIELALCGDPLEIFAMGAHFETCLSPDGINFFSVVTNAADVNKRVLYARRSGKVVGRCLLALTDEGRVLTFHPYAHDPKLALKTVVDDFVASLATAMGTRTASTGRVSLLMGKEWYDDGARDVAERYGALRQPELAEAIQAVAPSGLVALLEGALGRPLDDLTLPVVMGLAALTARPELIEPLAPRLLALRRLPDRTLIAAAALAARHGDLALADRLAAGPAERAPFHDHDAWELGRILARTRPSFALSRLRATRPRGVRRLEDEEGARLAVAALALETLRRPRQAIALYRRALTDADWLADELRPRLDALLA